VGGDEVVGDGVGDGEGDGLLELGAGVGVVLACGDVGPPAGELGAPELGGAELGGAELPGFVPETLGDGVDEAEGVGELDGDGVPGDELPDANKLPDVIGLTGAPGGTLASATDCPSGGAATSQRTTPTAAIQIAERQ
jgi:hypothetical protein